MKTNSPSLGQENTVYKTSIPKFSIRPASQTCIISRLRPSHSFWTSHVRPRIWLTVLFHSQRFLPYFFFFFNTLHFKNILPFWGIYFCSFCLDLFTSLTVVLPHRVSDLGCAAFISRTLAWPLTDGWPPSAPTPEGGFASLLQVPQCLVGPLPALPHPPPALRSAALRCWELAVTLNVTAEGREDATSSCQLPS